MRLSLIAMVLCLCAAWPGHGLAWGMTGSASPAGMTPGAPQSQAKGEVRFSNTLDPVAYSFIYKWDRELHEGHGCTCTAGEHGESGRGRVPL